MTVIPTWTIGTLLAAVIALTAWRMDWLTVSGALAAWVAGTVAMGAGWDWGILLVTYFGLSTAISRFRRSEKTRRAATYVEKPGARDAVQVASNGIFFVLAALMYWIEPRELWRCVACGALAASAADTWATEVGSLSRQQPRSILSWAPVPTGSSGGITLLGSFAALAGALSVALVAAAFDWTPAASWSALIGGTAGAFLDSVLGAAAQARYWCATCDLETERRRHDCGTETMRRSGVAWLNNDGVNALATAAGAAVGLGATLAIR